MIKKCIFLLLLVASSVQGAGLVNGTLSAGGGNGTNSNTGGGTNTVVLTGDVTGSGTTVSGVNTVPSTLGTSGLTTITNIATSTMLAGSNVLTIDPVRGNDTLAALDPYHALWKSAYGINYMATNTFFANEHYGACVSARPGDWIRVLAGYYTNIFSIPLNITGNGQSNGVNLLIDNGVTIIRPNGTAVANNTNIPAWVLGPLIIPGNGSIVTINGSIVTTNNNTPSMTDAVFGWDAGRQGFTGNFSTKKCFGFTNWIAKSFVLNGIGFFNPTNLVGNFTNIDNVYLQNSTGSAQALNTNDTYGLVEDLNMFSGWDNFLIGGTTGRVTLVTKNIHFQSLNNDHTASGMTLNAYVNWTDYGSDFGLVYKTNSTITAIQSGIVGNGGSQSHLNGTAFTIYGGTPTNNIFLLQGTPTSTVDGTYSLRIEDSTSTSNTTFSVIGNANITGNITNANGTMAASQFVVTGVGTNLTTTLNGSTLTSLAGANITAGTINSNKLDAGTLALLGGSPTVIVFANADQTVNNSVTLVDITGFTVPIVANGKYRFRAWIPHDLGLDDSALGIFKLVFPASPNYWRSSGFMHNLTVGFLMSCTDDSIANEINFTSGGGGYISGASLVIEGYLDNGANAGNIKIQFAQGNARPTNLIVQRGAYLEVTKLN